MMAKIGVIGGAGVAATNKLCELIENAVTRSGAYRDAHHPEMIIYQATQVPSRSMYLEGKGPSFIDGYIEIGKRLKACGADLICMSCNTAHYAIEEIEKKVEVPFINLIEEVALAVDRAAVKNVGLIASCGCLKGRVYEKYFDRICPGINIIYPNDKVQECVTDGICNIKNKSRFYPLTHPERPFNLFKIATEYLFEHGAEVVVLGCTDIRPDFSYHNTIDSLEILAESILRRIGSPLENL